MRKKGQIISSINAVVKENQSLRTLVGLCFFGKDNDVIVLSFFHSIGYIYVVS